MNYDLILFDLDGTIADTSEGIFHSYDYACDHLDIPRKTRSQLDGVIGGTLTEAFSTRFGLASTDAAIALYRQYYRTQGVYEVALYDGLIPLLQALRAQGCKTAVATLKFEGAALPQLRYLKIFDLFDAVCAADAACKLTKSDLIARALQQFCIPKQRAVLIGDSEFDAEGAAAVGVDFIGVTYGLGFQNKAQVCAHPHVLAADTVQEVQRFLLS